MAHKKGAGSTDNGRDSAPQYLGVKKFGGEHVLAGNIIVTQKGTKFHAGLNTYLGKTHTLHAKIEGIVGFKKVAEGKRVAYVLPMANASSTAIKISPEDQAAIDAKKAAAKAAAAQRAAKAAADLAATKLAADQAAAAKVAEKAAKAASKAKVEPVVAEPVKVKEVAETSIPVVEPTTQEVVKPEMAPVEVKVSPIAHVTAAEPEITATHVEEPAAVHETVSTTSTDDLKKIEGIGPKIAELLHADGIHTFAQLAATSAERVKEILHAAGPRYQMHNPETWGAQAALAADGKWDELKKWQDEMDGGRA